MHNLPLDSITLKILEYLDKGSPNFSEELFSAIAFEGLNNVIIYNNAKKPIGVVAEITEERQIIIHENYLAFLWCLSFISVTINNEGSITYKGLNKNISDAFKLFDYAFLLKEYWKSWPEELPNPSNSENQYVDEANALTIIAMRFIMAHEFGHHTLGHNLNGIGLGFQEARDEEFSADKFAFETLIEGYEENNNKYNHSINIATILALGSLLLLEHSWEAVNYHPNTDERLTRILQKLEDINGNESNYWVWGITILYLWNAKFRNQNAEMPKNKSAKEAYFNFVECLRNNQTT